MAAGYSYAMNTPHPLYLFAALAVGIFFCLLTINLAYGDAVAWNVTHAFTQTTSNLP